MMLGDDDAMATHFDESINFYSKSAQSVGYGEVYGIPIQEFLSRAKLNPQSWEYLNKRFYSRFDIEMKHSEISTNMKFSTSANKKDTETAEYKKDKIKENDFFNVAFCGMSIPERKIEMTLNNLRPVKRWCNIVPHEVNQASTRLSSNDNARKSSNPRLSASMKVSRPHKPVVNPNKTIELNSTSMTIGSIA